MENMILKVRGQKVLMSLERIDACLSGGEHKAGSQNLKSYSCVARIKLIQDHNDQYSTF